MHPQHAQARDAAAQMAHQMVDAAVAHGVDPNAIISLIPQVVTLVTQLISLFGHRQPGQPSVPAQAPTP